MENCIHQVIIKYLKRHGCCCQKQEYSKYNGLELLERAPALFLHFKCFDPLHISTFTVCLVGQILGGVENIGRKMGWKSGFSSVWHWVENRRGGKPGRKISLPGPQIFSSQIGRKIKGRKLCPVQFYQNALPLTLHSRPSPTPLKTFFQMTYHFFSSSSLYLQHTVHCSRFSPICFFFFNVIYCFLSSLYSSFSC